MNKKSFFSKQKTVELDKLKALNESDTISAAEVNRYLYNNLPVSVASAGILALILYYELRSYVDNLQLTIWLATVLTNLAIRVGLLVWFRKTKLNPTAQKYHFVLFTLTSSITAILWGILCSFLMPDNIFYQSLVIIFVTGILAGGSISLGAKYLTSLLYIFLTVIPMVIWMSLQVYNGNLIYSSIIIAIILYLLYTAIMAHKSSNVIVSNIKLKNKNLELLKNLSKNLNQIDLFSELGESLEQCHSEQEVGTICKKYLINIFPEFSGGMFLLSDVGTRLKATEVWGDFYSKNSVFDLGIDECLAIKTKVFCISHGAERCMHCPEESVYYVCMPLQTPIEFYGILHFRLRPGLVFHAESFISSQRALFTRIATTISFALSTIQYQNRLQIEATQDTLTGLYNRRYLDNYCTMEFARFKRSATSVAIIMLDIDHFKIFNDEYGHETGDMVLREVGALLKKSVRGSDFACRFGGEEFMIIMPGSNKDVALERAESIREGVKHIIILKDAKPIPNITISAGLSMFPEHGDTQATVIKAADEALYKAKETGRDRVCIANS
jgi:diguanylate cyclase (GGDEF)-like protein